ncbi:OPT oligopeptide transporter protein-domain-containing protein [Blastocladiella britannica]|nr:OPT oligopeptide transporter protein-domain-containing protein [Blastocladiella britannica]
MFSSRGTLSPPPPAPPVTPPPARDLPSLEGVRRPRPTRLSMPPRSLPPSLDRSVMSVSSATSPISPDNPYFTSEYLFDAIRTPPTPRVRSLEVDHQGHLITPPAQRRSSALNSVVVASDSLARSQAGSAVSLGRSASITSSLSLSLQPPGPPPPSSRTKRASERDSFRPPSSPTMLPPNKWSASQVSFAAPVNGTTSLDRTFTNTRDTVEGQLATGVQGFVVDKSFEKAIQEVVPSFDHPETPAFTFRVLVLGTLLCASMAAINQVYSFYNSPFAVSPIVAQVLAFPLGKLMEKTVPYWRIWAPRVGSFELNPGPFSVKEFTLIGIFASTGSYGVYGMANLVVTKHLFGRPLSTLTSLAFLLSSSLLGFGLAGLLRSALIRPASVVWPTVLPTVSLYSAFFGYGANADSTAMFPDGRRRSIDAASGAIFKWSRLHMFLVVTALIATWQLVPMFLAPGVANIGFGCLVDRVLSGPHEVWQTMGSFSTGLGFGSVTLDWTNIGSESMTVPFWTTANSFVGTVLFTWLLTGLAWRGNWFHDESTSSQPLNSIGLMYSDGSAFDPVPAGSDASNWATQSLALAVNSPLRISPYFAVAYLMSFAQFPAAVVHTAIWYGKDLLRRFRDVDRGKSDNDIHCRLIDQYPEVPQWAYTGLFAASAVVLALVNHLSGMSKLDSGAESSGDPLVVLFVVPIAILLGTFALLPVSVVYATAGVSIGLNVASEILWGYLCPGNPLALMTFKSIATLLTSQCTDMLSDLKLGHYMKVPPRHVFVSQLISQVITVGVCFGVTQSWFSIEDNLAALQHPDKTASLWSDAADRTFFSAAVIYGEIGPAKFFGPSSPYGSLLWLGVLIGITTPIVFKLGDMFIGGPVPWKFVQAPVLFSVASPGMVQTYLTPLAIAFFSQVWLFRRRLPTWKRYNYIVAAALDAGTGLTGALINAAAASLWPGLAFPTWALNPDPSLCSTQSLWGPALDFCVATMADTTNCK